jgi:hypothetical protein
MLLGFYSAMMHSIIATFSGKDSEKWAQSQIYLDLFLTKGGRMLLGKDGWRWSFHFLSTQSGKDTDSENATLQHCNNKVFRPLCVRNFVAD